MTINHTEKIGDRQLFISHTSGSVSSYVEIRDMEGTIKASGYIANDARGLEGNIADVKKVFSYGFK